MPKASSDRAERFCNDFVTYLFEDFQGNRHVRRVATWIGFVLKAVDRAAGPTMRKNRRRQILFDYGGKRFKARYNHKAGPRGGIEIVEVLPGRGMPDGPMAIQLKNLSEAEAAYRSFEYLLDTYVRTGRPATMA